MYEVRPEGRTGKPRVLHRSLLLPCAFLPVEPSEPPLRSTQGNVSTSSSKKVPGKFQTYKFGASDPGDENEPSGSYPTEFETLQMSAPIGGRERLMAEQPEQEANEVMTRRRYTS